MPHLNHFEPIGSLRSPPAPPFRRAWWCGVLLLGLLALPMQAKVDREYQLKAAFLYNFTKFIDWPPDRFASDSSPVIVGVVGRDSFGPILEAAVADRTTHGRPLVIRLIDSPDDLPLVHIVFIGACEYPLQANLVSAAQESGILSVGECEEFLNSGGMINFIIERDKVRFEINQIETDRAGYRVSAQLLKLARKVKRKS